MNRRDSFKAAALAVVCPLATAEAEPEDTIAQDMDPGDTPMDVYQYASQQANRIMQKPTKAERDLYLTAWKMEDPCMHGLILSYIRLAKKL